MRLRGEKREPGRVDEGNRPARREFSQHKRHPGRHDGKSEDSNQKVASSEKTCRRAPDTASSYAGHCNMTR